MSDDNKHTLSGRNSGDKLAQDDERTHLRAILDAIYLPVGLLSPEGVLLEANATPLRLADVKREEIIGRLFWETPWFSHSPVVRDQVREAFWRAAAGETVRTRLTARMGKASHAPLEVEFAPIRDSSGIVQAIVCAGANILGEVKAEASAERERTRLNEAQRIAHIGSWELDHASGELTWSDEVFRIFGVDRDQMQPSYQAFLDLVHPDDRMAVNTAYSQSLELRRPYEITHRLVTSANDVRWVHERCETDFDEAGCPLVSRGTVQDITQTRKAQLALRRSEETLASILSVSPEAIIVTDRKGIIRLFSEGAEAIFRCKASEAEGLSINEFLPERFRADHNRRLAEFATSSVASKRMNARTQITGLRRTGEEFPAEASISKVQRDNGLVFSVILRDISERRAYESALRASKQKAEAASEAKSAFLATMSHEIRTPMNGMLGMLSVLQATSLDEAQKEMVDTALDAGRNLMVLLNDILDYSRIEAGRVQIEIAEFDFRQVIRKVHSLHRLAAEQKGVNLTVSADLNLPERLLGDSTRIQQILHNIVGNAVKFTNSGNVNISVSWMRTEGASIGEAIIEISDTGIGMSEEQLAHVFDRFSQADSTITRRYGGSGLGLSIVKGLLEAMGGGISVASKAGDGSRFTVRLPLSFRAGDVDTGANGASGMGRPQTVELKVLIVEDNAPNARVLELLLQREGVVVALARNGEEAIAAFEPDKFDIVFMDIQMPVLDGEAAMRVLRRMETERGARASLMIACTAHVLGDRVSHYRAVGFDDVVAKPLDTTGIEQILARATERKDEWIAAQRSGPMSSADSTG